MKEIVGSIAIFGGIGCGMIFVGSCIMHGFWQGAFAPACVFMAFVVYVCLVEK